MTSIPASRRQRATTLAPRSCPSRPTFVIRIRSGLPVELCIRVEGHVEAPHKGNTKGTHFFLCFFVFPFCVTRLQLLVFWTKFSGHIPLLCEEGNMTQTATSSAFGCGVAALCLLCFVPSPVPPFA